MKIPLFGKISLAAKVGLLFAAAVLLIVGAALLVPWDRMQRLAEEQDVAEARDLAAMRLLERCGSPHVAAAGPDGRGPGAAGAPPAEPFQPARPGRLAQLWTKLRPDRAAEWPRTELIVPLPAIPADKKLSFKQKAVLYLKDHPDADQVYQYDDKKLRRPGAPPGEGSERRQLVLEYVRALRVGPRCAECHVSETSPKPFAANELVGIAYVEMPTLEPRLWGRVSVNLLFVIGAGVLAVALAIIVFYVIMKSLVLSPVRKLRRLADHIGEGDLSVRSTIRTGDEFERLAKAFNSMLERLQVSQQQLRQINESLNTKMDELAKANVALFESNRLKSEFLARVSHELRTPLNSIIGFAEVLRDQMAEGQEANGPYAKAARYADNILTSGRMLLELINDLLDLSKIEAGKMVVRIEKVVVRDRVEAVVNFMRPAAEKNNLQVSVLMDPDLPLVETDGGKFQQILYNLFSNAVKFTPPRGSVTVRAWRQDESELTLSVSDTGPGIPPEDQETIFEKFHQLDSPATREHGGTGLGLAISRELADMLGGKLTVVSKLGEGSTFTLTLPLQPAGAPKEAELSAT